MDEEQRIAAIVTNWAQAIERKDRNGILAAHSDDIIMFDFPNSAWHRRLREDVGFLR